ncbi:thiosulfate oxidation carrier protein SoxY [Paracoccus zhejiangensis]|uniref:Thiosulfate oxidation carrier protein SoxY n=1 Tax=Paracoccus zhejiangensis TaxID=1077935 RepID=A0A2H5F2Y9_9RHOB|nr:thiosulfate oxidation carrier protein SoxY [Paracoccus zhejiangensis]AUH65906.1 thiosulfate oxidation carrier protein SoxY [Paracoccus zhejiangensis]
MIDRREMLAAGLTGLALTALPWPARAVEPTADQLIVAFTGGVTPAGTGVTLDLPEVAENGFSVPVSLAAPGATEILLLAPENPWPQLARFRFGPLSGRQAVSTRIRLARTQEVIALARLADGNLARTSTWVEVIVGGCGA